MANKTKSGLPSGVSIVSNRPGLYRLTCMIQGSVSANITGPPKQAKRSCKANCKRWLTPSCERAERGTLKSGDISDKSTFSQAVEWFSNMRKLEIRESTQLADAFVFEHYLIPAPRQL